MACNFSCFMSFTDALKENDVGVFQSDCGDVYKVKYKSNVCRDLLLRIEWTVTKQILFTVKLYSTSFKRCFSSRGMVINGKKAFMKIRGAFNVSNSRNYKVLCVINLIPYIKFNDNNELSPELYDNSGSLKSEFQQSLIDKNNTVTYEERFFRNEKEDENRDVGNNSTVKVNEINILRECKNDRELNEIVHISSRKSEVKLDNIPKTDEMIIDEANMTNLEDVRLDESEMSVSVMNKDNLSVPDHSDKMIKNVHTVCMQTFENKILTEVNFIQNSENNKSDLEDSFVESPEDKLIDNSIKENREFALSKDISSDENAIVKSNCKDETLITKILTVDDCSKELIETIKNINIHTNLESNNTFSENNSSMEVDLQELSSESHSILCDENISLSNSDNKECETFSTNIAQEINQTEEMEFHTLSENNDTDYSQDLVESVTNSEKLKANFVLESSDISINKNHSYEKHYGKKHLTFLSNCNTDTHSQNSDQSKIETVSHTTLKDDSLPTEFHKTSEVKTAEINDAGKDIGHKSQSLKLSSSKTGLVFKTLVRKVSVEDLDLQLKDVKEGKASSSGRSLKNAQGSEIGKSKTFPTMESELKGLSMDMLDLLTTGDMADAEITNGKKHIKVHRAIVCARSSSLKEYFVKHKEGDINYSAFVDIPSYILEDVIIFLYVGLIYIKNKKMAKDLHQIAEKYGITDLIDICSKHI